MVNYIKNRLSGWGLNKKELCKINYFNENIPLEDLLKTKLIARGLGRSYGDSSYQKKMTIDMTRHNKIISFDKGKGILVVQSGISINSLLEKIVKHGWFLPVTPGSKFVTVGGMVASNVHGKNHHNDGGISNFIRKIEIIDRYQKLTTCSYRKNRALFISTIGGMGLTGIITRVHIKLLKIESSLIYQKKKYTQSLKETMNIFEKNKSKYSVAWVNFNCREKRLGSSVIFLGEHVKNKDLKKNNIIKKTDFKKRRRITIPFIPSFSIFNYFSISIFNFIYSNFQKLKTESFVEIDDYFYPLDNINYWNRLYGRNGFIQYQFVLPKKYSYKGLKEIFDYLISQKSIPFLPVLKYFSKEDIGLLSFPMKGYTLAMDFPDTKKIRKILNYLDKIVMNYDGRIYLTKDSRISKKNFEAMYKDKLKKFKQNKYLMLKLFSSSQSDRLFKG